MIYYYIQTRIFVPLKSIYKSSDILGYWKILFHFMGKITNNVKEIIVN